MSESENKSRVYEFSYLLSPHIPEDKLQAKVDEMKAKILAKGGEFVSEEAPKLITLSYEMVRVVSNKNIRFTTAYFGWMKFELDTETGESLQSMFSRDEEIIRYLTIKTVHENTLAPKKFTEKGGRRKEQAQQEQVQVEQTGEVEIKENPEEVLSTEEKIEDRIEENTLPIEE